MKRLIRSIHRDGPFEGLGAEWVSNTRRPRLAWALVALSGDEAHLAACAPAEGLQGRREAKMAWVQHVDPMIDAAIDAALEGDERGEVAEALARAGVDWQHEALCELLDDEHHREAAAGVLAGSPAALRRWLDHAEVVEEIFEVLRAGALNEADEWGVVLDEWRARLDELGGAEAEIAQIDGLLALWDPVRFSRRALVAEASDEWVDDPRALADFLQAWGPGSWASVAATLALFDDEAWPLGALLACCAVAGVHDEQLDDAEAEALADLLYLEPAAERKTWQASASALGLGFATALVDDPELAVLAVQVGAHERLVAAGYESPGVPGLALSATSVGDDALRRAEQLLRAAGEASEPAEHLAALRTLDDALGLVQAGEADIRAHALGWAERLSSSASAPLRWASARLSVACGQAPPAGDHHELAAALLSVAADHGDGDEWELVEKSARREDIVGLLCTQILADLGTLDALEALALSWVDGPVCRAPMLREALLAGVSRWAALDAAEP